LATAVLAGCGGKALPSGHAEDQSAQFQRHGFDVTFRYPAALKEADDLIFGSTAGSANCQSTPETRSELNGACDEALRTLERA
jgi:hypothetical protein